MSLRLRHLLGEYFEIARMEAEAALRKDRSNLQLQADVLQYRAEAARRTGLLDAAMMYTEQYIDLEKAARTEEDQARDRFKTRVCSVTFRAVCSGCLEHGPAAADETRAVRAAEAAGWRTSIFYLFCPACREIWKEGMSSEEFDRLKASSSW